jgi:hypothetical protein cdiviTM7_01085
MGYIFLRHPEAIKPLLYSGDFKFSTYLNNLKQAFLPFFTWHGVIESIFLAPQISLPATMIAIIGLVSTFKGFFASRNSIAIFLIIFTILISGFHTDYAVLLILPFAILIAHGLRYIIYKWYNLFPENPYAKFFGIIPITIFLFTMITSDLSHFISGYRYAAPVANQFNNDLSMVLTHAKAGDYLLLDENDEFSKLLIAANTVRPIFRDSLNYYIATNVNSLPKNSKVYTVGKANHTQLELQKVYTSSKSQNSDRLYLYIVK